MQPRLSGTVWAFPEWFAPAHLTPSSPVPCCQLSPLAAPVSLLPSLQRLDRRILLTRDRKLADRRDLGATAVLVVGSDESREQLREVVAHFGLRLSASEFMMRCSVCNGRGYIQIDKAEAGRRDDCPPKVLESVDDFYVCKTCGKLYWEGPKSNNAFDHFESIFEGFGALSHPELHEVVNEQGERGGAAAQPSPAIARMMSGCERDAASSL